MLEKRTDLALESHEIRAEKGVDDGIIITESAANGIKKTVAEVKEGEGEKRSGKKAGRYITLDIGDINLLAGAELERTAQEIARTLRSMLPAGEGTVLVVGLGNEGITPDSIGPKAIKKLIVTRHIKKSDPRLFDSAGFGSVAATCPGVLGQTGLESAETVECICRRIRPKCVILIDSLAARSISRLAATIQISDCGISPGSGVSNRRKAICAETLGCNVISLGIPTVVDAATLALDIAEMNLAENEKDAMAAVRKALGERSEGIFVSPKDIDVITDRAARLIAVSLNLALHGLSYADINACTD